jgi:PAS domain-containing protein
MSTPPRNRFIFFVITGYILLALIWIVLSNRLLLVFANLESMIWLSSAQQLVFVINTAALLFFALHAVPPANDNCRGKLHHTLNAGLALDQKPRWPIYLFAIASTLAMLLLRNVIAGTIDNRPLLIIFMLPIILSALLGGLGAGLLSTALAALGTNYFGIPPTKSLAIATNQDLFQWCFLIINGVAVSLLSAGLRKSLIKAKIDRHLLDNEQIMADRAKLEAALASMSDAVFISDNTGRFIHFNDAFVKFHKFKSRSECAQTLAEYPAFLEVYASDGIQLSVENWAVPRALHGETATDEEFMLRRKDSGETWFGSYNFAPIRDEAGAIIGSVVTAREITDRKQPDERRISWR